jgi:5-methylcytosine-specific restriction endonuclease McrA
VQTDIIVEANITLDNRRLNLSKAFVLDTNYQRLNPVPPGRARLLLSQGKAAVFRRFPFTIILKRAVDQPELEDLRIKIDPGSRTTGISVQSDATGEVVFAANLEHRGEEIKKRMASRRAVRHNRRSRHTRYRKPRFQNRRRKSGWLPPTLEARVSNILTWVNRLRRYCPITAISMELVKFDLQKHENPEIAGVEYQQGTLQGYETREYLLEKWNRQCAYCNKRDVPLQVEHIHPRANGGTNRLSNLCLACKTCNIAKGTQDIKDFLKKKPDVLKRLLAQAKVPLKDAAAVNTTRWALYERLKTTSLPVECGSGGLTKFNRTSRDLPKEHWVDAACVGKSTPECIRVSAVIPLHITACGYGRRQMCLMGKRGFPRTSPKAAKYVKGFQTGDLVRAVVTSGTKIGTYVGRVAVRTTGSFNMTTKQATIEGIGHQYCTTLHKCDGYSYGHGTPIPSPKKGGAIPPPVKTRGSLGPMR